MFLYVCKQTFPNLCGWITQEFLGLRMRNFQDITLIAITIYGEIFKSTLVYLQVNLSSNPSMDFVLSFCHWSVLFLSSFPIFTLFCTFLVWQVFHVELFSFCTFFVLYFFHVVNFHIALFNLFPPFQFSLYFPHVVLAVLSKNIERSIWTLFYIRSSMVLVKPQTKN